MAASHYLPLHTSSKSPQNVVVRITGTPHSFPLTVTATDGNAVFHKKLSKEDAKAGQSGRFGGTVDEWLKILFNALFSLGGGEEVVEAHISRKEDNLTISIEQKGDDDDDISVKMGALEIPADEDVEIDLVEWLIESSTATITAQTKTRKLEEATSSEQEAIAKLNDCLNKLIKEKEDYETALLKKFNVLLNEKKAKIRELTNNGPVPEARIPSSPSPTPEPAPENGEEQDKPKRGAGRARGRARGRTTATTTRAAKPAPKKAITRGKRKRTPTPEPEEDTAMPDVEDDDDVTADEESDQGGDERDDTAHMAFGPGGDDDGDVTEDEEL